MAGSWGTLKNQQMPNLKGFDEIENDLVMGVMLSQKHDHHLIQNCDLPPPMKVFSGPDHNKTALPTSIMKRKNTFSLMGNHEDVDEEDDGKLGLLKALRLSQTRAREAEAKCAAISKERDLLAFAFMENSMQVFAYRQWVRLLELQVSKLHQEKKKQEVCCDRRKREKVPEAEAMDDGSGSSGFSWIMALAFCFGIAGFGFALDFRYNYL